MKMHDPSFQDPIITQPEPITLILPFMMEILRSAGIKTSRDEVVKRLMTGSPRIAIVHGGEDHPAQVLDQKFVKKGQEEVQKDLLEGQAVLKKLRQRMRKEDLLKTLSYNFPEDLNKKGGIHKLTKDVFFDTLVKERKLRILIVVAGEGPRAHGIPEMFYPSEYLNRDVLLRYTAVLFTDGRYSGATYGPCIGHCSPEAFESGGIGAIGTGDWIYLNFDRGEIDLLDRERLLKRKEIGYPFFVMKEREIFSRPWIEKRIKKIEARKKELTPWARGFLDGLLSTAEGVGPKVMD